MTHVAVIGAGISGLSAAYRLHKAGARVTLLEASGRAGGVIRTLNDHDCLLEAGPDSWASNKPAGLELVRELGLEAEVIGTREGVRRSFILHKGKLKPLPEGFFLISPMSLRALWKTNVLSLPAKLRMACDLIRPRRRDDSDESLASFVRRRFGREALQRIAQPMVAGIYTADPERLSLKATFPQFIEYEQNFGSVIRGLRARSKAVPVEKTTAGPRYGLFVTLKQGMGAMTDALESALPAGTVRLNTPVRALKKTEAGVALELDGESLSADAAVLALPAPKASALLSDLDAPLAEALGAFEYAGAAVVNFIFARDQIGHPMDGIGAVIPAVEGRGIIAFSFSSVKFVGRAPEGLAIVRVFLGGALSPEVAAFPEPDLARVALAEICRLIDVKGEPVATHVASHHGAMPQYHVGHLDRVAGVRELAAKHSRIAICGNAFDGIGIPDCIRGANQVVAELLARVNSLRQAPGA
jgi:oxygen-dependent protoporphyrinogen oxidase